MTIAITVAEEAMVVSHTVLLATTFLEVHLAVVFHEAHLAVVSHAVRLIKEAVVAATAVAATVVEGDKKC